MPLVQTLLTHPPTPPNLHTPTPPQYAHPHTQWPPVENTHRPWRSVSCAITSGIISWSATCLGEFRPSYNQYSLEVGGGAAVLEHHLPLVSFICLSLMNHNWSVAAPSNFINKLINTPTNPPPHNTTTLPSPTYTKWLPWNPFFFPKTHSVQFTLLLYLDRH